MKILLLDDEKLSLELLEDAVLEVVPDAEVVCYSSAKDFVDSLDETDADIYFLDIHMPEISGIDVAGRIKQKNRKSNIIFVSCHDQYKGAAMDLHVSDYLLKPVSSQKIREALENLRYEIPDLFCGQTESKNALCASKEQARDIYAKTFGLFTLFVNQSPVLFHRRKSKELLAYLIERRGEIVPRSYLTYLLYADETHSRESQKKLYVIYKTLLSDLQTVGASRILIHNSEGLGIAPQMIRSDLYDYLDGDTSLYRGEYMEEYSWGENFKGANLFSQKKKSL